MHSDRILMSSGADPIQQLLTKQLFSDIRHPISISASDDNARKDTLSTNHTKFNSLRLYLTVRGILVIPYAPPSYTADLILYF